MFQVLFFSVFYFSPAPHKTKKYLWRSTSEYRLHPKLLEGFFLLLIGIGRSLKDEKGNWKHTEDKKINHFHKFLQMNHYITFLYIDLELSGIVYVLISGPIILRYVHSFQPWLIQIPNHFRLRNKFSWSFFLHLYLSVETAKKNLREFQFCSN